jgi:hypothetical protein
VAKEEIQENILQMALVKSAEKDTKKAVLVKVTALKRVGL